VCQLKCVGRGEAREERGYQVRRQDGGESSSGLGAVLAFRDLKNQGARAGRWFPRLPAPLPAAAVSVNASLAAVILDGWRQRAALTGLFKS
jgi:hypothetical protein